MIKIKTEWYYNNHRLLTELLNREDAIIEMLINETLDDVISQLDPVNDIEHIKWIKDIEAKIIKYIQIRTVEITELVNLYNTSFGRNNHKQFALEYKHHKDFYFTMQVIYGYPLYDIMKQYILKTTYRLRDAQNFLELI